MYFSDSTIDKINLIDRLRRQASSIEGIQNLQGYSLMPAETRTELSRLLDEIYMILRKLENNEFEIAVVGLEKAGKSSFCNALMEYRLLPTRQARCTYTSTNITYSEESRGEVRFQTRVEFDQELREKLARLGIQNVGLYNMDNLTQEVYEDLYENEVSAETKKWYGSTINQEIRDTIKYRASLSECLDSGTLHFIGNELNAPTFKQYIENPEKAMAVREVIIQSPILAKMQNAIIYDVPGFNSPTEMHRAQTKLRMDNADAIVMVAAADEPSIVDEELKTFKGNDADGIMLAEKLFVFANRADRANLDETIDKTYREWCETHAIVRDRNRIFFGSANAYLQSLHELDPEDDTDYADSLSRRLARLPEDEYEEERLEASFSEGYGILAIRSALERYNETDRLPVLAGRAARLEQRVMRTLDEMSRYISEAGEHETLTDIARDSMRFYVNFRDRIRISLGDYADMLKSDVLRDKPLSNTLVEYIRENIRPDKYADLIADALNRAKKDLNIIADNATGNINLPEVEIKVRRRVFGEMYLDQFSDKTAMIISEQHDQCVDQMLDLCMQAMDVPQGSANYTKLREMLADELAPLLDPEASVNHYQSLIDRYSRDIFELLIGQTYSYHRYDRFAPDMGSFFSMAVYYDPDAEPTRKADISRITDSSLKQSIFCYEMLCHDYSHGKFERAVEAAASSVRQQLGVSALPSELQKLVAKVVRQDPRNAVTAISDIASAAARTFSGESERLEDIRSGLKAMLSAGYKSLLDVDITDRDAFISVYQTCFDTNRVYDDVVNDLRDDIEILREVLEHCFIRALDPEKPFITKEYNTIRKLLTYIDSDEFIDFISKNLSLIRGTEFDKLEKKRLEEESRDACRRVMQEIAGTMADDATPGPYGVN